MNEILTGVHECDIEMLMAKVILIHKDKDIAILDHYRPIALLNTIYQLIMLITTSRLRQLTEYYAVIQGSQYGFRTHRGVQMVVQRAHWVQQQAIKESWILRTLSTRQDTPASGQFSEVWGSPMLISSKSYTANRG